MSELNTQLPTSVELSGKPKWEVRRIWSDFYCDYAWAILNPDGFFEGDLETWREAMDYADRMARTVEMTLPRVLYGDRVIAGKGLYSLHVDYRPHCTDITLGGWDGITVENRHLWDLAMYLAACARHRKEQK